MKPVWFILGFTCLALGMIGAVLPLLPTVPFMLLAAFCFARSSQRMHNWLTTHKVFGPMIADWHTHGAIRRKAKIWATVSIGAVLAISVISNVPEKVIYIQLVTLSVVLLFIWTRPNGPD